MNTVNLSTAYETAGRKLFRDIYSGEKSAIAEVFELLGGTVAARYHALGDWDAVELEGFEAAKHLPAQTDSDSTYLLLRLREIAGDPAAAYRSMWSSVVEIAQVDWEAIREIAERLPAPAA